MVAFHFDGPRAPWIWLPGPLPWPHKGRRERWRWLEASSLPPPSPYHPYPALKTYVMCQDRFKLKVKYVQFQLLLVNMWWFLMDGVSCSSWWTMVAAFEGWEEINLHTTNVGLANPFFYFWLPSFPRLGKCLSLTALPLAKSLVDVRQCNDLPGKQGGGGAKQ